MKKKKNVSYLLSMLICLFLLPITLYAQPSGKGVVSVKDTSTETFPWQIIFSPNGGVIDNGDGTTTVNLDTALTTTYLKLDQTTPQDISNGQPDFLAGLRAGSTNQLSIDASGNTLTTGTLGAGASTLTSVKTATIFPPADSTTAIQINKADGTTNVLNVDTTNARVGIGTTSPLTLLHIKGAHVSGYGLGFYESTGSDALLTIRSGVVSSASSSGLRLQVNNGTTGEFFVRNFNGILEFQDSTQVGFLNMIQGGNVGIGTTTPTAGLHILTAGAASTPGERLDGTWYTGGTATTTKPHFLIEPAGTTTTAWSTSGTGLGVNAASGFTGNLADLQVAAVSIFNVSGTGQATLTGAVPMFKFMDNASTTNFLKFGVVNSGGYYYPGIWGSVATPSVTNYLMLEETAAGSIIFNAPANKLIYFRIANADALTISASKRIGVYNVTAPTGLLHIGAGTATASTAPLKFTSGTNLTTAEAGAVEYNGTNLFFTRTGTTREYVLVGATGAAPSTTLTPTFTSYYGGNTNALGDPVAWMLVTYGATVYKVPLYT